MVIARTKKRNYATFTVGNKRIGSMDTIKSMVSRASREEKRKALKLVIKSAKRMCWLDFCEEVDRDPWADRIRRS